MERKEIEERVIDRVRFVGQCDAMLDDNLCNDLSFDSLDVMDLEMQLEKKFHIKFRNGELTNDLNVSEIVDLVQKKI